MSCNLRSCVWLRREHVQQQVPASSCKLSFIFLCLYASVWKKIFTQSIDIVWPQVFFACLHQRMIYFRLHASPLFPSAWSARESVEKVRTQLQCEPDPMCGPLTTLWCLEFGDDVSLVFFILFHVMRSSWVPNKKSSPRANMWRPSLCPGLPLRHQVWSDWGSLCHYSVLSLKRLLSSDGIGIKINIKMEMEPRN